MQSNRCIVAIAGLSLAIAGVTPAAAADPMELAQATDSGAASAAPAVPAPAPATPPQADKPGSGGLHWYVGTGIGPAIGPKYKLNGQTIKFDDRLQTDKTSPIGLNLINAGIALRPDLLVGLSVSAGSQTGKIAGNDAHLQINNYFATATWLPAEQGFFVRGGIGFSNIIIDTGVSSDTTSGYGLMVGMGYALRIGQHHNVTLTADYTHQSYNGSTTRPSSSEFSAAYLGYMYRH